MSKCIENYTLDELKNIMPNVPYDKIEIFYEYTHRKKNITAPIFANNHCISVATLHRYVRIVKKCFKAVIK